VKKQVPLTPVLAVALAIVVAVGWFAFVGPKRAQSGAIDAQIGDYQAKIVAAQKPKTPAGTPVVEINVADLFRLAKAMPDQEDMPGVLLELDAVAKSAGVKFVSITPGAQVSTGVFYSTPITLAFEGNYYDLTDFLFRLRNLVTVREGELDASGRLYTLDLLQFAESEAGFPSISATLTVSAYTYGAPLPAAAPTDTAATSTGTSTTTTGSTTTGETTTGQTTTGQTTTGQAGAENGTAGAVGETP
jgi:Tfp pilus assembly protein PilO